MLNDKLLSRTDGSIGYCSIENPTTAGMLLLIDTRERVGTRGFLRPNSIRIRFLNIRAGIVDRAQCLWRCENHAIVAVANDRSFLVSARLPARTTRLTHHILDAIATARYDGLPLKYAKRKANLSTEQGLDPDIVRADGRRCSKRR